MKIIPSINTETFTEAKEKINQLKNIIQEFHLDIANLGFTGYQTWNNPKNLTLLDENLSFQVHLMVPLNPQAILQWNLKSIKFLILHLEASSSPYALLKFAKKLKKTLILAWAPSVEKDFIDEFIRYFNGLLILGVQPGRSGQNFLEITFDKLQIANEYRKLYKNLKLFVDGGINENNIKKIVQYQPDYLIMGKAIFNGDPVQNYKKFSDYLNVQMV